MTVHAPKEAGGAATKTPGDGPAEPSRLEKRLVGALVKALFLRGRRGKSWPVPEDLDARPLALRGNSGARLSALHFPLADPWARNGIVVLAHPDRRYGKHWFVREGWVAWLLAQGFEAVTFDFAPYGKSRGGSTYLHDDVRAACEAARRLRPGEPVHLVGLSIGAFASLNAAASLPWLASLVLESPYPTFADWYSEAAGRGRERTLRRVNATMARLWPRTAARIDAGANARRVRVGRVLVAASRADEVTPSALSRTVLEALPAGTRWHEVPAAPHLGLFQDAAYRAAILETLRPGPWRSVTAPSAPGAALKAPGRAPVETGAPKRLYESGREPEPSRVTS